MVIAVSKPPRTRTSHQKEFVKIFDALKYRHGRWTIWADFVTMAACTLSMADADQRGKREEMYGNIAKNYTADELEQFVEMFTIIVRALEEEPNQDFLGELFMLLELNNDHNGQFFTPYNVCKMMAMMQSGDLPDLIAEKGYISANDCACGAGALLIAFANEARRKGVNYQRHVLFVAQDIDFTAAMMCYIQLSILGCPGYVIVGDTITTPPTEPLTNQNVWYTVMYFNEIWHWRRVIKTLKAMGKKSEVIAEPAGTKTEAPKTQQKKPDPGFIQLSLFD